MERGREEGWRLERQGVAKAGVQRRELGCTVASREASWRRLLARNVDIARRGRERRAFQHVRVAGSISADSILW